MLHRYWHLFAFLKTFWQFQLIHGIIRLAKRIVRVIGCANLFLILLVGYLQATPSAADPSNIR